MQSATLRIVPADDNEFLAVEAFGLDPDTAIARRIGLVGLLRNQALDLEGAGLPQNVGPITRHMLAEPQPVTCLCKHRFQSILALEQGPWPRVDAVDVKEVEQKKYEIP
jgi:hypothetical protein